MRRFFGDAAEGRGEEAAAVGLGGVAEGGQGFGLERLEGGRRQHGVSVTARLHDAGRYRHVHTEPVAADLARAAGVQADAHLGAVARHLHAGQVLLRGDRRLHGPVRRAEHRHHTVTHPLDHPAAPIHDRRLDGLGHAAQQLNVASS